MGWTNVPGKNEVQIALLPLSTFSVGRLGSAEAQRLCFFFFALETKHSAGGRNDVTTYNRKRAATITFLRIEQGNIFSDFPTYVMHDK
jgi:hypothetical protein